MSELLHSLAGTLTIFGYSIPIVWLVAGACFLLAGICRAVWPAFLGGVMLYCIYYIPTLSSP